MMPVPPDETLRALQERAKELNCVYRVIEILAAEHERLELLLPRVVEAMTAGWQYPEICRPALTIAHERYGLPAGQETPWRQAAPILVRGRAVGELAVHYTEERPPAWEGPFLQEERQLLDTLADRLGIFIMQRELAAAQARWHPSALAAPESSDWREYLARLDDRLRLWVTRKMLNHLRWKGAEVAAFAPETAPGGGADGDNRPLAVASAGRALETDVVFAAADRYCPAGEILGCLRQWVSQDRIGFLIGTLEDRAASLAQITDALERFEVANVAEDELPHSVQTMLRVALLRCFFTDDIAFINTARSVVSLTDFHPLSRRLIFPTASHGKLGGKSAGLFLAQRIVEESPERDSVLSDVRVPRTWYIASDGVLAFIRYNNFEDVYDRKYMELEQVRQQYPYVVQTFKSAVFPPELVNGLVTALEDLGERPLIVRSSSLLEDRTGAVFSGKYKSLFLANQGTLEERLRALQDAVAEVYASIFGPDPIEYRAERNLLDVHEEMGIMIQEVVGRRVGRYFLPAFAGVAFSNNEFRWSPRIRREDGLVRLVPGLGTRAVDRLTDDYPVLLAPGRPGLRANTTVDEIVRYAPKMVDLINLETNSFETVPVAQLLRECGAELPMVRRMISIVDHDRMKRPTGLHIDFAQTEAVVTFEGLAADSRFVNRMTTLLRVLRERLGGPVDIEFASDGRDFYLLQCRPQCYASSSSASIIPRDVPADRVVFTANRYISNGTVPDISHIVYVDPGSYRRLSSEAELRDVGRAVSRLNKVLPKRRFILMGPGRWGSRGDIRLGVSITYSDVNNTAMLVEIARRSGNYVPDLSFGTHFFQDLVEADIRYLPLYPDEPGVRFNERFLLRARNALSALLPEFTGLAHTIKVIDVARETGGRSLRILLNGEQDEAIGFLTDLPGEASGRDLA